MEPQEIKNNILSYIYETLVFLTDSIAVILNSNFITSTFASAFGAFGGAYCLWLINKKQEHNKDLAKINSTVALLIAHLNSLLNFKKQHVLPINEEMNDILEKLSNPDKHAQNGYLEIKAHKIVLQVLEMKLDVSGLSENLARYADQDSKALLLSIKTKNALLAVFEITQLRNNILNQMQNDKSMKDDKKILYYLGQLEIEGTRNEVLKDTTEGLLLNVDTAIHFIDLLIPIVQKIGTKILPKKMSEKIIKHEIVAEYQSMIPAKDFIKE